MRQTLQSLFGFDLPTAQKWVIAFGVILVLLVLLGLFARQIKDGRLRIETAALEALPATWRKQRLLVSLARRAWMYAVLLVPGCMFVHSILQHRLITCAVLEGFSPRALALMLQGKAY